mmetsp:Transcript_24369/g.28072  ORF Transcript_24369/g.28072 Transcript_24369/m.28072 type:complete len:304 (-) Transcript_24369:13-924(-)|eukprot:CAMPEP_0194363302 /NCGR_PEP_ID=MMETSP0174-20130528/11126_1 /TAXON_ID=216777 /ORGANISM="Proboscia alata, Strain PI-D3" /LENGTH=303 /DNA_ID=CAMNT_0039136657 /DNA_START=128 /DNA_END=1039 /DNA_ORIENTATION=-
MIFNRSGAILAVLLSSTHAFGGIFKSSIFLPRTTCTTSLSMGKSKTMPGPAGSSSSGPTMSEFRAKKMANKKKKKKKNKENKGGFSTVDDNDEDNSKKGERPFMEVDLVAEPEGDDMPRLVPLENDTSLIRLKDLGPVDESDEAYALKDKLGSSVHNYWLTAYADGSNIGKTRNEIVREASQNADFPGFRKGVVPPYAQGKMTTFALQEVMVQSCQAAILPFGVNEINEDELGVVTFKEDMDDITARYDAKRYPSVRFTATFRGLPPTAEEVATAKAAAAAEPAAEGAIDVDSSASDASSNMD